MRPNSNATINRNGDTNIKLPMKNADDLFLCPFCSSMQCSSNMDGHYKKCKEKLVFYSEYGYANRLIDYFSSQDRLEQSQLAMKKWKKWEAMSGNGGINIVKLNLHSAR